MVEYVERVTVTSEEPQCRRREELGRHPTRGSGQDMDQDRSAQQGDHCVTYARECGVGGKQAGDRKSTRLNSSHLVISYAVFCLKKKTTKLLQLTRHCLH